MAISYFTRTEDGDRTVFSVHPTSVGFGLPIVVLGSTTLLLLPAFLLTMIFNSYIPLFAWAIFLTYVIGKLAWGIGARSAVTVSVSSEGIAIDRAKFPRANIAELFVRRGARQELTLRTPANRFMMGSGAEGLAMGLASGIVGGAVGIGMGVGNAATIVGTAMMASHFQSNCAIFLRSKTDSRPILVANFLTEQTATSLVNDVIDTLDSKPV